MRHSSFSYVNRVMLNILLVVVVLAVMGSVTRLPAEMTTLRLGIIPHRSNLGNEQAYSPLIDTLEKQTGFRINWVGSHSYADVIDKLGNHTIDLAYMGAFSYVRARERFDVQLIARTLSKDGQAFYLSMIVTHKDSGLMNLQDLKGKQFAFTDPHSTSGYLFPLTALRKAGVDLDDFSQFNFLKRHANSLLAVYNRHVDAGAISSTAPDKVDVDIDQFRVLWESAPIYRGPWVARKGLPISTVRQIRSALLNISQSPMADKIFANLGTKGFTVGHDSDYDNIRQVLNYVEAQTGH